MSTFDKDERALIDKLRNKYAPQVRHVCLRPEHVSLSLQTCWQQNVTSTIVSHAFGNEMQGHAPIRGTGAEVLGLPDASTPAESDAACRRVRAAADSIDVRQCAVCQGSGMQVEVYEHRRLEVGPQSRCNTQLFSMLPRNPARADSICTCAAHMHRLLRTRSASAQGWRRSAGRG
jgi:hypothetical protein